ncbi:ubiquinol--cytochrome-c reductase subunit 10 SCDLUD_004073 [Saccharomycodes ludwigii]|uniref:ubiquinol--cytochrome-c reductase subunit 10 n=1 Tax=Saccharomycodes ludwigii TaxID=36035 RepID=UPI001E880E8E|nr:hypothetical protein SCDLUD_004073 [Saccharomycodes ludwigii]KAH3899782.1 hypothetical protein SCDLUD_004073 [Saccharomycodes ludwigii]
MVAYISSLSSKTATHFGRLTLRNFINYIPDLALWGGASAFGIACFTENWPIFQDTFYKKIPYFGSHWVHDVDPQDVPN